MKRIVIKIGSNVLTRPDGTLDVTRISSLVDQVQAIRADGAQVLLVSSGAVACGRSLLGRGGAAHKLDPVEQRQLFSAVGQVRLIGLYSRLFQDWNTTVGQVLTMKESFSTRREYLNQRACMEVMLANGVIPIINENDTVSVTELMFTDNDELSGLVASMMDADTLIILSNVDGIYDGPPSDPTSKVIAKVQPGEDISDGISAQKSGFGRGGMRSKYSIATHAAEEGIRVLIANGKREGIVKDLYFGVPGTVCTEFVPVQGGVSSVKKWIAHSSGFAKGTNVLSEAMSSYVARGGTFMKITYPLVPSSTRRNVDVFVVSNTYDSVRNRDCLWLYFSRELPMKPSMSLPYVSESGFTTNRVAGTFSVQDVAGSHWTNAVTITRFRDGLDNPIAYEKCHPCWFSRPAALRGVPIFLYRHGSFGSRESGLEWGSLAVTVDGTPTITGEVTNAVEGTVAVFSNGGFTGTYRLEDE